MSSVFIIRIFIPKVKPGVFKVGFNIGFLTWYMHSMLNRAARVMSIHYLLHSTNTMRWLYWKALGADVAFNIHASFKITIHDAQLITIMEGAILSEDVEISCHLIRGDKLFIAPVVIGKNVFIGRSTYIGPKTKIGQNAWIGMENTLIRKQIPENSVIESSEIKFKHSHQKIENDTP